LVSFSPEPLNPIASARQRTPGSHKNPKSTGHDAVDPLIGEWRVKCEFRAYDKGESRPIQDQADSLVVVETDPDGSYYLYRFPVGFGEGLPRLRKVSDNRYEGADTIKGITTVVKQIVSLENDTITIKQTIFDAPSDQPKSETSCTGTRWRSPVKNWPAGSRTEICASDHGPAQSPDKSIAGRYASVRPFSDGMAAVATIAQGSRSQKWGYINETGRVVIPLRYDEVTSFHDGLAAVGNYYGTARNLKWAVVEKLGPQVTPQVKYDAVKILGEGFAAVGYAVQGESGLKWNLINRENTTVFHGFDDIECFVGGRARAAHKEGKAVRRGYVNKVGDFFADKM